MVSSVMKARVEDAALFPAARRTLRLGLAGPLCLALAALAGCSSNESATVLAPTEWQVRVESPVEKSSGLARSNPAEGTGLARVARASVAAMLAAPGVSGAATAPRVIVDPANIVLNGPMDPQTLADRLRCELNETANGRLQFLDGIAAGVQLQKKRPAPEYRLGAVAAPAPTPAPGAKPGSVSWTITLRLMGPRATTPVWSESYVFEDQP